MPQTLTHAWKVHLGDKFQNIHDLYVHNIGNLSLTADNSELGNKTFEDKKSILKEQSKLKLNRFFINSNSWNEEKIKQRADLLFEEAKELWNYENNDMDILKSIDEKEFYTIDDDFDITGKKPISFEIDGQKFNVKSWKEILIKTLEYLSEIDLSIVKSFTQDNDFQGRERRIISTNKDDMRNHIQLKDGIFVETNLSANSIIANIKLICEKFGLDNDDFIYYVK